MALCHLKNSELEPQHQKHKGRVVLRGDIAKTQVKMKDASTLSKIPKSACPDIWIRLPKLKCPKSWSSMDDPVVPLEKNLYGHPLAGLL